MPDRLDPAGRTLRQVTYAVGGGGSFTGRIPGTGDLTVADGQTAVAYGGTLTSIDGVITVAGEVVDT